jgi:hypothetical protein
LTARGSVGFCFNAADVAHVETLYALQYRATRSTFVRALLHELIKRIAHGRQFGYLSMQFRYVFHGNRFDIRAGSVLTSP